MTCCWELRHCQCPWSNPSTANMDSSRSTKSKGFAGLLCIFGGRQHWEVLSYKQGHLAASLPQSRLRSRQGFADAFGCHWNHRWPALYVGYIRLCCIPYQKASRLRVSPSCDGTCSVSILLKVTSCLPPPVLSSSTSSEATVWGQTSVAQQQFLDPLKHSFYKDTTGQVKPVTTDVLPAPKAIIEMVRCQCRGPRTYRAQTSVFAALSVRMMRTLGLTCCRTVTVMMMNESIRWWWPSPLKCNDNINNSDYS